MLPNTAQMLTSRAISITAEANAGCTCRPRPPDEGHSQAEDFTYSSVQIRGPFLKTEHSQGEKE